MILPTAQYEPIKTTESMVVEPEEAISSIENPFNLKQVDISQRIYSIDLIMNKLGRSPAEIDLGIGFQRRSNLWTAVQQSRLIESMLIRIPIPVFYFDATDPDKWLVIDGLQRISTLKNFILDKNLKLTGLEFYSEFEGKGYDDLPSDLKRRLDETQLTSFFINPGTDPQIKFIIFQRLNTGGTPLNSQEIRHTLYNGKPADFIEKLSSISEFVIATGNVLDPIRMLDREFVTRFVAFYLLGPENYHNNMELYLNEGMNKIYSISSNNMLKIENDFRKAMQAAIDLFGEHAFRKSNPLEETKKPLNKALFDVWSYSLSKLNANELNDLQNKKSFFLSEYTKILQFDDFFQNSITNSTGDKIRVRNRFSIVNNLIQKTIKL